MLTFLHLALRRLATPAAATPIRTTTRRLSVVADTPSERLSTPRQTPRPVRLRLVGAGQTA